MAETSHDALEHRIRRLENKGDGVNKLWHELTNLKVPLSVFAGALAFAVTAYNWADDLDDAQHETQKQLNQLVKIVTKGTEERNKQDEIHDKALTSIEKSLALIVLEATLRRELEKENEITSN